MRSKVNQYIDYITPLRQERPTAPESVDTPLVPAKNVILSPGKPVTPPPPSYHVQKAHLTVMELCMRNTPLQSIRSPRSRPRPATKALPIMTIQDLCLRFGKQEKISEFNLTNSLRGFSGTPAVVNDVNIFLRRHSPQGRLCYGMDASNEDYMG